MPVEKHKRPPRVDGVTWMVSVIHPSLSHFEGGSNYWAEVPGRDARDAAQNYAGVMEDNLGAELVQKDPEMTLVVVIDQALAGNLKPWKVHVFSIQFEIKNGKLIPTAKDFF